MSPEGSGRIKQNPLRSLWVKEKGRNGERDDTVIQVE